MKTNNGKAVNMFAESGRYFQTLPPASERKAKKLDEWFKEPERIFRFAKGERA